MDHSNILAQICVTFDWWHLEGSCVTTRTMILQLVGLSDWKKLYPSQIPSKFEAKSTFEIL